MKKLTLTFTVLLLALALKAQTHTDYLNAMKKGIAEMNADLGAEQFSQTANYFERIAQSETREWLPLYYTAYCDLLAAQRGQQPGEQKDALYDKAMSYVEKAAALKGDKSEIETLTGYIIFMKMSVDPANRAMTMISDAGNHFADAIRANPENPRPYFVQGQDTFYTPEAFGGGAGNAKPFLVTAMKKYEKENITDIEPSWGKSLCQALLQKCN